MENTNHNETNILDRAYGASNPYAHPEDGEKVSAIVDTIGDISRESYLALRAAWRVRYADLSADSRRTKPQRKGGNTVARDRCLELRTEARRLMAVRFAIRECARRHAAQNRREA